MASLVGAGAVLKSGVEEVLVVDDDDDIAVY